VRTISLTASAGGEDRINPSVAATRARGGDIFFTSACIVAVDNLRFVTALNEQQRIKNTPRKTQAFINVLRERQNKT